MENLNNRLAEWNNIRGRDAKLASRLFIARIPVLGFLIRTFVRTRDMGRLWYAQKAVYTAMIAELGQMEQRLNERDAQILNTPPPMPLPPQLPITPLVVHEPVFSSDKVLSGERKQHLEAEMLQRMREVEDRTSKYDHAQKAMDANGSTALAQRLDETEKRLTDALTVLQINTSYIRWLEQKSLADHPSSNNGEHCELEHFQGDGLTTLIKRLEQEVPDLAKARNIDLSIQDSAAEDILLSSAGYFNGKLSTSAISTPVDAWYHIDYTPNWNRPILFENAVSGKLAPLGKFVLITDAEHDDHLTPPGLTQRLDKLFEVSSGERVRVCVFAQRD